MFGDIDKVVNTIGHLVTGVEILRQSIDQLTIAVQALTRKIEEKGNGDV